MRFSYNLFIRAYSFFSVLFFIFGALAIVIGGPALFESYTWSDPAIESAVFVFRLIVIFFFGAGFVISSLILIVTRRKGFVAYKRMIDRLSSGRSMNFNLNITFPEQDEFGNLGKWLNKFMEQVRIFDKIKVEKLRALQQQVAFLTESIDKGVVIVSSESKISSVNTHFVQLLNIGEKSVIGLPINKVVENESILQALDEIKDKPKNQVLEDLKIKSGDTVYKTKVTIVPIISSEVTLMETMIIFDYIQKRVLQR
jgi:signal transduction histidine kinase